MEFGDGLLKVVVVVWDGLLVWWVGPVVDGLVEVLGDGGVGGLVGGVVVVVWSQNNGCREGFRKS